MYESCKSILCEQLLSLYHYLPMWVYAGNASHNSIMHCHIPIYRRFRVIYSNPQFQSMIQSFVHYIQFITNSLCAYCVLNRQRRCGYWWLPRRTFWPRDMPPDASRGAKCGRTAMPYPASSTPSGHDPRCAPARWLTPYTVPKYLRWTEKGHEFVDDISLYVPVPFAYDLLLVADREYPFQIPSVRLTQFPLSYCHRLREYWVRCILEWLQILNFISMLTVSKYVHGFRGNWFSPWKCYILWIPFISVHGHYKVDGSRSHTLSHWLNVVIANVTSLRTV